MINLSGFSKLIEKVIERIKPQTEKMLGEATERGTSSILNTRNFISPGFYSILTAKPFPNKLLEDKFYVTFLPKQYNNVVRYSLSKSIGEMEFNSRMLGENGIKIAKEILTGLDSIRSISQGQIPVYERWRGKTIEQISQELQNLIDNTPPTVISFLRKYKSVSDEIGEYLNIRNKMKQNFEESFVKNAVETLGDKHKLLEDIRKRLKFRTAEDWSLWNMYMPHIDAFNDVFDEKALAELADVWGLPGKKASAIFTRKRRGSIFEVEDDPTLAYSILKFGLEYLKWTDEISQRSLRSADLFVKMTGEERKEFFQWLTQGNTLAEAERNRYLELINKPKLTQTEQEELLSLQNKAKAGLKSRLEINQPIPLRAFDNYPRLKAFFERMIESKYITTHLSDEPSIVLYDFHSLFGKSAKSEEAKTRIAEIILEEVGELDAISDLATKDMAKGIRRYFLIDADTYELLNEISNRWFRKGGDLQLSSIRNSVRFWKYFVTVGTRFIPWRLANSIGDFYLTTIQDPAVWKHIGEAINSAVQIAFEGKLPPKLIELGINEKNLIQSGIFNPDLIPIMGEVRFLRGTLFESVVGFLNKISTTAELTPKIASLLANFERVQRGETPNFIGAMRGIREMHRAGGEWAKIAIFERASDISIDYSNIPPEFRKYLSDLLAPFAYWYVRTFTKWLDMFLTKEGFLRATAFALGPFVAMYYWNTSDPEREKVWRGLPSWLKFHSIISGFDIDEKTGKKTPIIFRFYTGGDWVADLLGFNKALELAERVQGGELTPMQAATTYLFGLPTNVASKFAGLLNPIAQAFIMMATNRDTFRGTKIVDDEIFNTPEGKRLVFEYAMNYVFLSPIVPAMTAGHSQAYDFLREVYTSRDIDKVKEFMNEYADRFFNPSRALLIEPDRVDYYMSKAAQEEYYRLLNRQEEFFEGIYQDLKKNDFESIKRKIEAVQENQVEGITIQRIWQYFQRPSFRTRYIKEILLPKIKDEHMREQINLLLNYYQTYDLLTKRARKELKSPVKDYYESLYEILYGNQ